MYDNLTDTQRTIYNVLLECEMTAAELADKMGSGRSVIYDHISGLKSKGVPVHQDIDGKYVVGGEEPPVNSYNVVAQTSASQQTITKKANEYFADLELMLKPRLTRYKQPVQEGGFEQREGGVDLLVHITDTHIGDKITTYGFDGEEVVEYDTEIAVRRIKKIFQAVHDYAAELEQLGYKVDTVHVALGGDLVTNECIYPQMPWDVDSTINEQLQTAIEVFDEEISRLADSFPSIQVVGQNGNHGEFNRKKASSGQANADDFLFSVLDYLVRKGDYDNITMVVNEHEWHTNFRMRNGKWTVHMRHGQKTLGHAGTSSGKQKWQSWMDNTGPDQEGADLGIYGHEHQVKVEPLPDGTFVIMGGSTKGPDEFAESIAAYNGSMTAIHLVTDDRVLENTRYVDFH